MRPWQLSCTYDCAHGNGSNSSATCASGTWQVRQFASSCSVDAGTDEGEGGDASDAGDSSDARDGDG